MTETYEKLKQERDEAVTRRQKLIKRLRLPQGDISDSQWVIMHHQLHAMDKLVSCLRARVANMEAEDD